MAEDGPSQETASPSLGSMETLRTAWDSFRAGGVVPCPHDAAPLALSVDAVATAYRFVCTRCGMASSWFESTPSGHIEIRATGPTSASMSR
jgi:hypothetical protein